MPNSKRPSNLVKKAAASLTAVGEEHGLSPGEVAVLAQYVVYGDKEAAFDAGFPEHAGKVDSMTKRRAVDELVNGDGGAAFSRAYQKAYGASDILTQNQVCAHLSEAMGNARRDGDDNLRVRIGLALAKIKGWDGTIERDMKPNVGLRVVVDESKRDAEDAEYRSNLVDARQAHEDNQKSLSKLLPAADG